MWYIFNTYALLNLLLKSLLSEVWSQKVLKKSLFSIHQPWLVFSVNISLVFYESMLNYLLRIFLPKCWNKCLLDNQCWFNSNWLRWHQPLFVHTDMEFIHMSHIAIILQCKVWIHSCINGRKQQVENCFHVSLIGPCGVWLQSEIIKFPTHFNNKYLK